MRRIRLLALALLTAVLLTGCKSFDVERLMAQPSPTRYPELTQGPGFVPPPSPEAGNLSLRVTRPDATSFTLADSACAQLVLNAARSPHNRPVDTPDWNCPNTVEVLQGEQVLETIALIDDGSCYARNTKGEAFFFPDYAYGRLEEAGWKAFSTLLSGPLTWDPDKGTAALEVRLPVYARAAMAATLGNADAYFHTFRIVQTQTEKNTATLYLVGGYAAYNLDGETLSMTKQVRTATRVVLDRVGDNTWRLAAYEMADRSGDSRQERSDKLRQILPYELMEPVEKQLSDTALEADMVKEIRLQAMQYLQARGLGRYTVVN